MTTIGITSVGSGVGQSVLRALALGELHGRTVGMDVSAANSGIYWVDVPVLIPPVRSGEPHRRAIHEAVDRHGIEVLIPGNDQELAPIAASRDELVGMGCVPIVSSPAAVHLSGDKLAMAEWAAARDLPFIDTWSLPDARSRPSTLTFPMIAKPRAGSASEGIALVRDEAALTDLEGDDAIIVQPYLPPVTRALRREESLGLQQNHEVSAQYLLGRDGRVLGSFVSINRLKAGIPIEIVPVDDEPWAHDGRGIVEALAAEGAIGPVNLQGRLTEEGRVVFFEANLRFTGITGVRTMMGYREVEAAVHALVDGDDATASRLLRKPDGLIGFRHVGDSVVPAQRVASLSAPRTTTPDPGAARPETVVVTGATSYLGRNTVDALLGSGVERLFVVVRPTTEVPSGWPSDRVELIRGDLLADDLTLPPADALVHLAALRAPAERGARTPRLFETNVEATARLGHAAREAGIKRVVYASSQAVYGTQRPPLWSESLPARPESDYAMSKWLGETALRVIDDIEVFLLRFSRLYGVGPGMRWQELPHKFAASAVAGLPLEVDGSGEQRMDLLHVRDGAAALVAALSAPAAIGAQVVNVGGGPVSVHTLASTMMSAAARSGTAAEIRHRGRPDQPHGASFGMHVRRARALLGWSPAVALDEAARELVAAARARATSGQ